MATLYENLSSSETTPENESTRDESEREISEANDVYDTSLSYANLESSILIDTLKNQSIADVKRTFRNNLLEKYFSNDQMPSSAQLSANSDTIITNSLILLWSNNSKKYNKEWMPDTSWYTISEWIPYLGADKCKFIQNVVWAKPDGKFWAQSLLLVINALWWDVSNYVWKLSNSYKVDHSVLESHRPTETDNENEWNEVFDEDIDSWDVEIFGKFHLSFDKSSVRSIKHNERTNTITISTKDWSTTLSYKNGGIRYTNHELFSLTKNWNDTYRLSSRKESFDATKTIFDEYSINYDSTGIDSFDYDYDKWCYILKSWNKTCELSWNDETNSITLTDDKYFHLSKSGNSKKNLYLWTWEWSDDTENDRENDREDNEDDTNELFDSEISQITDDIAYDGEWNLLTIPGYKSYNKLSTDLIGWLIDSECSDQHGKAWKHSWYHIWHDDCLSEMSQWKFKYNEKNGNIEYTNTNDGKNIKIFIRKMKTEDGSKYFISEKWIDGLSCGFDDLSEAINTLKLIEYIKIRFDWLETWANTWNSSYDACTSNSSPFFIWDKALYFSTDHWSLSGIIWAYDDENIISTNDFWKVSKIFRKYNNRVEFAKYLVNSVDYDIEH